MANIHEDHLIKNTYGYLYLSTYFATIMPSICTHCKHIIKNSWYNTNQCMYGETSHTLEYLHLVGGEGGGYSETAV